MDKIVVMCRSGWLQKLVADRKIEIDAECQGDSLAGQCRLADPVYGARPLKRVIQRRLAAGPAGAIAKLEGKIADGAKITVGASKTGLTINGQEFAASSDDALDNAPSHSALRSGLP